MHEYSIVQAMFDRIEQVARERGATAVRRVAVQVGNAAGLDVTLFRSAFELFQERTICDAARLEVEEVPARWVCPTGHGPVQAGRRLTCEVCGAPARLEAGDEITLMGLDLEVSDV
jgi:hydrogenase nickel incorporation protein HypA/HybF